MIGRRALLTGTGGLLLSGCDKIVAVPATRRILFAGDDIQKALQRTLQDRHALAVEYSPDQMSPYFRPNGTTNPGTPEYAALAAGSFKDWRLRVSGMVDRPISLSLADLQNMPTRSQITRHDCVEGWSAIGKWTGPMLGNVLKAALIRPSARYVVFHCADSFNGTPYYESMDMVDAFHPQTILAWGMNDRPLPVAHGAPVRVRIERQLGYKNAKFVMAIEVVESLDGVGRGKGGYWEDAIDYDWYAGI